MVRMQVYLTEQERDALSRLAHTTGKGESELIREAVDRLIRHSSPVTDGGSVTRAAGLWRDRTDLPDFRSLRSEWDRG